MADMDIEMDIDVGIVDDMAVQDVEILQAEPEVQLNGQAPNDTSSPDNLQPAPEKVHIRGLDNLTTKDIKDFASEYFSAGRVERVEWIDDSSANIIYDSPEVAREALIAFSAQELSDPSLLPLLQTIPAKPLSQHPQTNLEIRLAVLGDRKQAGARERSRFYLFNPEHDPAERRKRAPGRRGGNSYRDRDDGGYRSQRYDDYEQRRRQDGDRNAGFNASLYDDDDAALASRADRRNDRRGSASSGSDSRGRDSRRVKARGSAGKELFPDRSDRGRLLRDRSASPARDSAAERNREKARIIKGRLRETDAEPKELFPSKTATQRSGAFDITDDTADLFANKMSVPFTDGNSDGRLNRGSSLASRITSNDLASRITTRGEERDVLNIRGTAKVPTGPGFAIKGTADVRELFPAKNNSGKELFGDKLEGRGGRRQRAEDLFR
ncbi:hypothetical protein BP6252_02180 [Coleophoma cylindrospora]|uniref:Uncharacterized protein n=1 Tax=Coleophoma cylindrospora TaxID=1849047 RepID=A0A3D8SE31_9HELO|nr:hypothetical protein BP6252_02180 [Coleophoma cylindrospora]